MDADQTIKEITSLRTRLKGAQETAADARAEVKRAQEDVEQAEAVLRELGLDPSDESSIEKWIQKESASIDKLLTKAEDSLAKAKDMTDGNL